MGNCSAHDDQARVSNESVFAFDDEGCRTFDLIVNNCIVGVLCIVGMIGNVVSTVVLRMDRQNRIASFLLQTLACTDNFLLAYSFIALNIFAKIHVRKDILSILNAFGYLIQAASIWVTVLLGINRYYAVCKPLKVGLVTLRSVKIQVAIVFLLCFVFNIPRFFLKGFSSASSDDETRNHFNQSLEKSNSSQDILREIVNSKKMAYESVYTVLVLILPLVLLICLNIKLARSLGKLRRRLVNFKREYKGSNEANITVVMIVIVVVLVVCHTPDRVLQTLKLLRFYRNMAVSKPRDRTSFPCCPNVFSTTQYLTNLFIVFSSSVNFLIYFMLRKRFRRILVYKLSKIFSKCRCAGHSFNTTSTHPSKCHHRTFHNDAGIDESPIVVF